MGETIGIRLVMVDLCRRYSSLAAACRIKREIYNVG